MMTFIAGLFVLWFWLTFVFYVGIAWREAKQGEEPPVTPGQIMGLAATVAGILTAIVAFLMLVGFAHWYLIGGL